MNKIEMTIPYCANCKNKTKKDGLKPGDYYCDVVKDLLPQGIVRYDTDGQRCLKDGFYAPIE